MFCDVIVTCLSLYMCVCVLFFRQRVVVEIKIFNSVNTQSSRARRITTSKCCFKLWLSKISISTEVTDHEIDNKKVKELVVKNSCKLELLSLRSPH